MAAAAARTSASAAKHSCVDGGSAGVQDVSNLVQIAARLYSAPPSRGPSASALTGGCAWRGAGRAKAAGAKKARRGSRPTSRAFSSTVARSSGRNRTERACRAAASRCRSVYRMRLRVVVRRHGRTAHDAKARATATGRGDALPRKPEGAETGTVSACRLRHTGGDATGRALPAPCQVERRQAAESRMT
jgi:hypothetical protein